MSVRVKMTEAHHQQIHDHLYPGDGKEAVTLALCGRQKTPAGDEFLLIKELFHVPYESCSVRTGVEITWNTELLTPIMQQALKDGLGIVKIHSHPGGGRRFSEYDDASDKSIFETIACVLDDNRPHASLIMLPSGELVGRAILPNGDFQPLERISVIGERIKIYEYHEDTVVPLHSKRTVQAFGEGTYAQLRKLKIVVVGVSGTGSLVTEQLVRTGIGQLVLLDPKEVNEKNLNRIPHASLADAQSRRMKVDVLEDYIKSTGLDVEVTAINGDLFDEEVMREVASCDVVIGCMDTAEGRHLLNRLATFYLLPYIDVGVLLNADNQGGIDEISGGVHYLFPGGSSLLSRNVIHHEQIRADAMYRTDQETYAEALSEGYVRGVNVERPAVMPVNMIYAGLAVMELLARLHGFRYDNAQFARQNLRLDEGIYKTSPDGEPCPALSKHVGRGDVIPMLDRTS